MTAAVAIIMGSQSDWETMRHASETLAALGIASEQHAYTAILLSLPRHVCEPGDPGWAVDAVVGATRGDEQLLEIAQRALFVQAHQPAVAGDVGRQDGGEPAFGALLLVHGSEFRGATITSRPLLREVVA